VEDVILDIDMPPRATQGGSPTPALGLTGHLPTKRTFALGDLLRLPRHELGPTQVNCFTGRPVTSVRSYAGVRLIDILAAAAMSSQPRSQLKRCVVVAAGLDGYRVLFSWNELYNSFIGEGVLVLYERNCEALNDRLGPLCLISANDRQLGPRHLKQLRSVHVQSL
jgi:hypothetical protein